MIILDLGQQKDWEYDVRALTSSFYPGEEVMLCNGLVDGGAPQPAVKTPAGRRQSGQPIAGGGQEESPAPQEDPRVLRIADYILRTVRIRTR